MIKDIIHHIEIIQETGMIGIMIGMIEEIDIVSRERSRSPGDYNSRGYRGRSNSGSRYQGGRQPPKKCSFCGRMGHPIEVCWDFQKYLEKIGKQLTKVKNNPLSKRKNDEDSSVKAFVIQSVNSLLEDIVLGIESTN